MKIIVEYFVKGYKIFISLVKGIIFLKNIFIVVSIIVMILNFLVLLIVNFLIVIVRNEVIVE